MSTELVVITILNCTYKKKTNPLLILSFCYQFFGFITIPNGPKNRKVIVIDESGYFFTEP